MSYVLRVWQQPAGEAFPSNLPDTMALLTRLYGDAVPDDSVFPAFASRLTTRYPCISATDAAASLADEPAWADGPLDGMTEVAVYDLSLVWQAVDRVRPFVLEQARQLGLNVMDEQVGEAYFANGKVLSVQVTLDRLDRSEKAYRAGDHALAFQEYAALAADGVADAQYHLGRLYELGEGTAVDLTEALAWYAKAARRSHGAANSRLGALYLSGKQIPQDDKLALECFKEGARRGRVDAQRSLGMMYEQGRGTDKNPEEAARWYARAAECNDASAQLALGRLYTRGEGVPQDMALAKKWIRASAAQNYRGAYFAMGTLYLTGQGVPVNLALAFALHRFAAVGDALLTAGANRLSPPEKLDATELAAAKKLRTGLNLAREPLAFIEKKFGRLDQPADALRN